jgi:hypothetical protein
MKAALEAGMDPERTSSSQTLRPCYGSSLPGSAFGVRAQVEDTGAFAAAALDLKVQQKQDADPSSGDCEESLGRRTGFKNAIDYHTTE